ncbi:MAG: hypothetical protein ABSF23_18415 [Terracidiphilus sp.]|jgi:hypothetical protein
MAASEIAERRFRPNWQQIGSRVVDPGRHRSNSSVFFYWHYFSGHESTKRLSASQQYHDVVARPITSAPDRQASPNPNQLYGLAVDLAQKETGGRADSCLGNASGL